ncbi:MAG TPA: phage holin family protein [Candidatus Dormibacteraeota bacterium]|nr:phage holin family protein [Candidatus Dormibacteraeota bacterium]
MREFVVSTIITAIALAIVIWLFPNITLTGENRYVALLVVAVVFGVVNGFIKPLVKALSFPVTLLTLGLFSLVINGLMLLLTAAISSDFGAKLTIDKFPPEMSIGALLTAMLAAIVLSIVRAIVDALTPG